MRFNDTPTHPPVVSHSPANKVGIVDDVVMRQGGALWSSSRSLINKITNYLHGHKRVLIQRVKVTAAGGFYCSVNTTDDENTAECVRVVI